MASTTLTGIAVSPFRILIRRVGDAATHRTSTRHAIGARHRSDGATRSIASKEIDVARQDCRHGRLQEYAVSRLDRSPFAACRRRHGKARQAVLALRGDARIPLITME